MSNTASLKLSDNFCRKEVKSIYEKDGTTTEVPSRYEEYKAKNKLWENTNIQKSDMESEDESNAKNKKS